MDAPQSTHLELVGFLMNTGIAIATVVAILLAPRWGEKRARASDEHREKQKRKWEIFRTLMRYREHEESEEFVGALNLIEIEFRDQESVIMARKELIRHLYKEPPVGEPSLSAHTKEKERRKVFLLQAVAKACGVEIDNLDIAYDAYSPSKWGASKQQLEETKMWANQILGGSRHLSVRIVEAPKNIAVGDSSCDRASPAQSPQSESSIPPSPDASNESSTAASEGSLCDRAQPAQSRQPVSSVPPSHDATNESSTTASEGSLCDRAQPAQSCQSESSIPPSPDATIESSTGKKNNGEDD